MLTENRMDSDEETERIFEEKRTENAAKRKRLREDDPDTAEKRLQRISVSRASKPADDGLSELRKEVEAKKAEDALKWQQVAKLQDQVIARVAEADKPRELLTKLETGQETLGIRRIGQRANVFGSNTDGLCLTTGIDTFGH